MEGFLGNINSKDLRMGEHPSISGYASARGLARLGALMANKGSIEGKSLMS